MDRRRLLERSLKGFEGRGTSPKMGTVLKWRRALEHAGVILIDPDGKSDEGGAGVRLRGSQAGAKQEAKKPR